MCSPISVATGGATGGCTGICRFTPQIIASLSVIGVLLAQVAEKIVLVEAR